MDSEHIAFYVHGRENMAGLLPALRTVTSFRRVLRTQILTIPCSCMELCEWRIQGDHEHHAQRHLLRITPFFSGQSVLAWLLRLLQKA